MPSHAPPKQLLMNILISHHQFPNRVWFQKRNHDCLRRGEGRERRRNWDERLPPFPALAEVAVGARLSLGSAIVPWKHLSQFKSPYNNRLHNQIAMRFFVRTFQILGQLHNSIQIQSLTISRSIQASKCLTISRRHIPTACLRHGRHNVFGPLSPPGRKPPFAFLASSPTVVA